MRRLTPLLTLTLSSLFFSFASHAQEDSTTRTTQFILGPVAIGYDEHVKVCMTDTSRVPGIRQKVSSREAQNELIGQVAIFDSAGASSIDSEDYSAIVFNGGWGNCANVDGRDVGRDGLSRSVIIVLTTTVDAEATFNPIVSGQLIAPNNTSGVALLLPAVQAAPDAKACEYTNTCPNNGSGN